MSICDFDTTAEPTPQRDEQLIGKLQAVDNYCRELGVDPTPAMPQVEGVIKAMQPVREAAEAKGMKGRERRVLGDAVADAVRREML